MTVKALPDDYPVVTPYLMVERLGELVDFLERVFGARERGRLTRPDGSVMHAEVDINGGLVMLGEPMGEFGPMPASVFVFVEDCDAVFARAVEAGGEVVMEPTHMHHAGERYGGVRGPGGTLWWIATHVEDLSWEEQQRRIDALPAMEG